MTFAVDPIQAFPSLTSEEVARAIPRILGAIKTHFKMELDFDFRQTDISLIQGADVIEIVDLLQFRSLQQRGVNLIARAQLFARQAGHPIRLVKVGPHNELFSTVVGNALVRQVRIFARLIPIPEIVADPQLGLNYLPLARAIPQVGDSVVVLLKSWSGLIGKLIAFSETEAVIEIPSRKHGQLRYSTKSKNVRVYGQAQ